MWRLYNLANSTNVIPAKAGMTAKVWAIAH